MVPKQNKHKKTKPNYILSWTFIIIAFEITAFTFYKHNDNLIFYLFCILIHWFYLLLFFRLSEMFVVYKEIPTTLFGN